MTKAFNAIWLQFLLLIIHGTIVHPSSIINDQVREAVDQIANEFEFKTAEQVFSMKLCLQIVAWNKIYFQVKEEAEAALIKKWKVQNLAEKKDNEKINSTTKKDNTSKRWGFHMFVTQSLPLPQTAILFWAE